MTVRLFSSDLDGTLLGNLDSTRRFRTWWEKLTEQNRPVLVYNSGRHMNDLRGLLGRIPLPAPDFLIGSVGTEVFDCREKRLLEDVASDFDARWNLAAVERIVSRIPDIERQLPEFCNAYKSSWTIPQPVGKRLADLQEQFRTEELPVSIIFSHHSDLDILPFGVNKGSTLLWLCRKLGIHPENVVVAGNSGNDTAMFQVPDVRGIVARDSHADLLEAIGDRSFFHASGEIADGVIEGLEFFGVAG